MKKLISLEEALRIVDETSARMKAETQKAREAEAEYWRGVFNEDRVEELEAEIARLEAVNVLLLDAALAAAHRLRQVDTSADNYAAPHEVRSHVYHARAALQEALNNIGKGGDA